MPSVEEIKAKLKALSKGGGGGKIWKPKDNHSVRILPLVGDEYPTNELAVSVFWHYGVDAGKKMYCPKNTGDSCSFCDFAESLYSYNDENGKKKSKEQKDEDFQIYKKVNAAEKFYVPIVVRKEKSTEVEGPVWWEMTQKTFQTLLEITINDDWNEDHPDGGGYKILTSLRAGLDLEVSLLPKNSPENKTNFDLTKVQERKKFTELVKGDLAAAERIVESIPSLREIIRPITGKAAADIFDKFALSQGEDSKPESEVDYNGEKVSEGGNSVDDTVSRLEQMIKKQTGS